jgi:predicted helicase
MAGKGKTVLFLVPSLSLLSQTLTEWTQESETPLHSFAVCSDSDVGKTRNLDDDSIQATVSDLQYPATTNPKSLAGAFAARHDAEHMSVIYATYHSIAVIHDAQKLYGLPEIDLIVCDEAHRTTGATCSWNRFKVLMQNGKLLFADSFFQTHRCSNSMMSFSRFTCINSLALHIVKTKSFKG